MFMSPIVELVTIEARDVIIIVYHSQKDLNCIDKSADALLDWRREMAGAKVLYSVQRDFANDGDCS